MAHDNIDTHREKESEKTVNNEQVEVGDYVRIVTGDSGAIKTILSNGQMMIRGENGSAVWFGAAEIRAYCSLHRDHTRAEPDMGNKGHQDPLKAALRDSAYKGSGPDPDLWLYSIARLAQQYRSALRRGEVTPAKWLKSEIWEALEDLAGPGPHDAGIGQDGGGGPVAGRTPRGRSGNLSDS